MKINLNKIKSSYSFLEFKAPGWETLITNEWFYCFIFEFKEIVLPNMKILWVMGE